MVYKKSRVAIVLILILYVSAILSGVFIFQGAVTIRPENVIAPFFIIFMLLNIIVKNERIKIHKISWLFILFICLNWSVSVFLSPVLSDSIKGLITLTVLVFTFITFTMTIQLHTQSLIKISIVSFLVLGSMEALYGIISYIIYLTNGMDIGGLMYGQQGLSVSVKGTFEEANIFGAFNSIVILLTFSLLISRHYKNKNMILVFLLLINFSAIILSWTRSAWLGTLIGVIFILFIKGKQFVKFKNVFLFVLIIGSVAAIIKYVSPSFDELSGSTGLFYTKIFEIFDPNSDTAIYRMGEFQDAINQWTNSPLFGNGYLSIKVFGETKWISNIFLLLLDDSGIIGTLLFLSPVFYILLRCIKVSRTSRKGKKEMMLYNSHITGLTAGFMSLLFIFNFTPTHTLLFFWWYMGLLVLFVTNYRKDVQMGD